MYKIFLNKIINILILIYVVQKYILLSIIYRVTSLDIFADIKDLKTVDQYTSLAELGMNSMMAVEIKQTLEREYDIFLTAEDFRNLNFAKLTEMCDKELELENVEQTTETPTIQMFIQILGNEELSTETCMELETKMDPRKIKVFLLPGIQGCGKIFNSLASKIRPIATALQYGITNTRSKHMSIPEYADHLLPVRICRKA